MQRKVCFFGKQKRFCPGNSAFFSFACEKFERQTKEERTKRRSSPREKTLLPLPLFIFRPRPRPSSSLLYFPCLEEDAPLFLPAFRKTRKGILPSRNKKFSLPKNPPL